MPLSLVKIRENTYECVVGNNLEDVGRKKDSRIRQPEPVLWRKSETLPAEYSPGTVTLRHCQEVV